MKKALFILLFTALAAGCFSQTAIGARGLFGVDGNAYGGLEFSLQKPGQSEFDLGFLNDSWKFTGLKLFELIPSNGIGLYLGAGMGLGYYQPYDEVFATFAGNIGSYIMLGPIQVGLDWRPEWNFFNTPGNDLTFNLALSGRLVFGR